MSRPAPLLTGVAAGAALTAALGASLTLGAAEIAPAQVWRVIAAQLGWASGEGIPPWVTTVVLDVRLPRAVVGALAGGGLALCGCALQGMFRNPLADAGVLGLASGASLGAVCALYWGLAARVVWALPALAFAGALVTAWTVYRIASHRGVTPVATLLLAGIALGAIAQALTSFVLFLSLEEYEVGRQIVLWTLGGLEGRTWGHVALVGPPTLLAAAIVLAHARNLDALLLGESHAASVGVDVPRARRHLIVATALLVGGAVAVSGVIGFVGLVIPHLLRLVLGPRHRPLLVTSWWVGAAFLVAADVAARTLIAPKELRLGVITAALGGPFFLGLLVRHRREAWFG